MRLPNRFGSISKLSGKRRNPYIAKKFVMWKTDDEAKKVRPVYRIVGYYPTKKAALEALAQANLNPKTDEQITLKQIYAEWSKKKYPTISATNKKNYVNAWEKYMIPLHDADMKSINTFDIENCISDMDVPRTMRKYCKIVLHQLYRYAIAHDICNKDYSQLADFGIDNDAKIERKVFTKDEIKAFAGKTDVFSDMIVIGCHTGFRPIELCELTLDEIDFEKGMIYLRGTKTESGKNRRCPVHPNILSTLQRNAGKSAKFATQRVFVDDNGVPVSYATFYDRVSKMGHTPHDTRHTFASYSKMCGMDDYARKEIMGHSQGKQNVTDFTYTHVDEDYLKSEMGKLLLL